MMTAVQSLWRWKVGRPSEFVGLNNYLDLLNDPLFLNAVRASAGITVGIVIIGFLVSLGLALILNDESLRAGRWFRLAIFLPVVTDWVATGLIWQLIFLPHQAAGAGLKSVPRELIEAARVDGANSFEAFRHITVPLLMPILSFVIVVSFVSAISLFEPVFMLTGGGPADATKTLPLFLHEQFFAFLNGGYASASGILFLLICLIFAVFAARQLRQTAYEEA